MADMNSFSFTFEEPFEFAPRMPEELLVKAMHSTRPIFLTDHFMSQVALTKPDAVVKEMVRDLHRDADPDDTAEVLRWHYLFMDFEQDFPRLLLMAQSTEA